MSRHAVECECHAVIPVPDGADGPLKCGCGRFVVLPSPEEFEGKSVLLSAATLERRIQRLVDAEQLPPDHECAWCGAPESEPADLRLVWERSWSRTSGGAKSIVPKAFLLLLLLALTPIIIFPFLFIFLLRPEEEGVEILGRDTTVSVPVCACEACSQSLCQPPRSVAGIVLAVLADIGLASVIATISPIVGAVVGLVLLLVLLVGVAWRRSSAEKQRQRRIKDRLAQVPVYAQLLREYPHAIALLPGWVWLSKRWSTRGVD